MRVSKRLHSLIVPLGALALGAIGCQTAQRPSALLPAAQANAPALLAAARPVPQAQAESQPARREPVPAPSSPPLTQVDAVAEVIAQVEKEYQAGQENYAAGRLDAAKQNFDHALGLMGSPEYALSDPRLQQEFEKVLEALNSPGLQPTQDAEGDQQKAEPAPIDEANEATTAVDPKVKAVAEAEVKVTHSDLPLMLTDPVAGYINYFSTRGRGVLERALTRAGRYHEMIRRILGEEGVPQDLIYLAQAESGFHPLALSRAGARGMWQFMGSRAKGYGLQRNLWVDDRQDPEKSTRAAARHLKDLYNQFGDWYLAIAAYNSGPGRVQSAVKRTGYADFWQLYKRNVLPRETRNYVPIILAVTIMAKNPAQYGLEEVVPDKAVQFDTVRINYPVDLRLVAQCVDASAADIQDLNPSLLRLTTPKDREFELHLPLGTQEKYQAAMAAVPKDMRLWWRYHKVAPGDTLAGVARSYHSTPPAIAAANHLDGQALELDSKLVIPIAAGKHPASEIATYARRITRYKVHRGDTVRSVADNFSVPPSMVRRWNHLKGDSLAGRRVLYVHLPVTPRPQETQRVASKSKSKKTLPAVDGEGTPVHHKVRQGETLYSIANSYKTTVAALKRANHNVATLRPGMILVIRDSQ